MDKLSKAKSYALRLLTFRQRSIGELKTKLHQKGYPEQVIHQVLEYLKECRLVDDTKYAMQIVDSMLNKSRPVGVLRIKQELKKREINAETIDQVLGQIDEHDELVRARNLITKTLKSEGKEYNRDKLGALLQRRGFRYDTIYTILAELD